MHPEELWCASNILLYIRTRHAHSLSLSYDILPIIKQQWRSRCSQPPNLEFMLTKLECVFQILTPDLRVEQAVGDWLDGCIHFVAKHIHEPQLRQVTAEQLNRLERRVKFLEATYLSIGVRVFHCIFMVRGEGLKNPPFPSHKMRGNS